MKKNYLKPSTILVQTYTERIMNGGSVVKGDGSKAGSLGQVSGGNKDDNGTVWGDAKNFNAWSGWDE